MFYTYLCNIYIFVLKTIKLIVLIYRNLKDPKSLKNCFNKYLLGNHSRFFGSFFSSKQKDYKYLLRWRRWGRITNREHIFIGDIYIYINIYELFLLSTFAAPNPACIKMAAIYVFLWIYLWQTRLYSSLPPSKPNVYVFFLCLLLLVCYFIWLHKFYADSVTCHF